MAGMGPPPKNPTQRARRNATVAMTALPSEGRTAPAPPWPLPDDPHLAAAVAFHGGEIRRLQRELKSTEDGRTGRKLERALGRERSKLALAREQLRGQRDLELAVWAEAWATPQAAQWERMRWTRDVAMYVRLRVMGELGDLNAAKEARQLSDRLGLSPLALLRLRWIVAVDEVGAKRAEHQQPEPAAAGAGEEPAAPPGSPAAGEDPFSALRAV